SLQMGLILAAIFSLLIPITGHFHAVQVAKTQPAKLAAFEAIFEDTAGAGLVIWGFPDVENRTLRFPIRIPKLLSFLINFDPNSVIPGLERFPREEWPPIRRTFYSYHIMILLGVWFIFVSWWGIFLGKRRFENSAFLKTLAFSIALPWVALQLGWMAAEFGRQPWVVYGLLKTKDAVSVVVPAWQLLLSIIGLAVIYVFILAALIYLLRREFLRGPEPVVVGVPAGRLATKEE
ncbi:MAG: cytochrome ubiquinol oxidase subunit I, partial [Anaerolineae bacterium]|nr:cytochrome ubiquinol oxidase subunit I [Anaerolineae bacterium]